MSSDFTSENARERQRLATLVARLTDAMFWLASNPRSGAGFR